MQRKHEEYANRFDLWLIILFVLNISDLIFSYGGLQAGIIEEANPIMAYLYETSILFFFMFKILVPFLLIISISRLLKFCENTELINALVYTAVFIYASINAYHIYWVYKYYLLMYV